MNPPTTTSPPAVLPSALSAGLELMAARRLQDRDDIRDVVQETLARTLAAMREGRIPDTVAVGAYAHGVALHVIADVLRDRSRHMEELSGDTPDHQPCALSHLIGREERQQVRAALQRLDAADRDILIASCVDGARLVELAVQQGVPVERLRKRKSRALARLRALMLPHSGANT